MKHDRTLVILTPAFPANESETVWVQSKQLFVRKLKENFPSLKIIILSFNYPYHTREYLWRGIRVIGFNGMHTRKLKRLLLWMRVWRKLKSIKKQENISGILSFWCGECALVGNRFAKRNAIKHFCWISGMDAKKENKLVKLIRPQPNELIAMSAFLVNEFNKNHLIKPQHTIPIGIDASEFAEVSAKRDIDILGVGTFNAFKQYDVFIHIVKELSMTFPSIKAIICGEGTEKTRLEELIKNLKLENNITLTGLVTHGEVLQYMQRARVFIHPSLYEGFGAVCIEALYAGAYVISFCDPMQIQINRWQIAKTKEDMKAKALEILNNPFPDHKPILLYSMNDSVKAIMDLFKINTF